VVARLESKALFQGIDKPVSDLALGTAFYRSGEKEKWLGILDDFLERGGTVMDTASAYGDSEAVIGEWLEARRARDQMIIITKCASGEDSILPGENFEEVVTRESEQSLESLRTDYIDVYMLHRDNPAVPVGRILDRLNQELDWGRVHALGASNWTYSGIDEANAYAQKHSLGGFGVVSNNLSLGDAAGPFYRGLVSTDTSGERWHQQTGIPLVPWSSQAAGFFTGRYTPAMRDQRDSIEDPFTRRMVEIYCTDENFERLRRAQTLGKKKGSYSAVQIALGWLLHKSFAVVPIVGPHTREKLASCVDAVSLELTDAELGWLNLEE